MNTHDELLRQIDAYIEENTKFSEKGVKAAAGRARKALNEIRKLAATRRKEITEAKNALAAKKD
jgi:ElaB/YqjD/DUF883 family membrane-anchored ribosome-binding protein